jgi:hypothetical protein
MSKKTSSAISLGHRGMGLNMRTDREHVKSLGMVTVPDHALYHYAECVCRVLLVALGLLWARLDLGAAASRIACWFLIYSALATIAGFVIAGMWGAGSSIIPIAAGGARGSEFQEVLIALVMYSAAPTGITSFALILWSSR